MRSSLQIIVCFVEVLLLDLNLGYLVEGAALEELVIAHPNHLFEVEDRVVAIVKLLKGFRLIEV